MSVDETKVNQEETLKEAVNPAADQNVEVDSTAEQHDESSEEEKTKMMNDFNEKFGEYATLTKEENLDDFKKEAEAKFDELTKSFSELQLDIETSSPKKALAVAKFLKEWNKNFSKWTNQEWKAVIHFNEVIDAKIQELRDAKADKLSLDVYTITYIFEKMKEPEATGLDSAMLMAKYETKNEKKEDSFAFVDILHVLMNQVKYMQCLNKQATILQNVVAMAESGYKLDLKITELEEFVKFFDAMQNQK